MMFGTTILCDYLKHAKTTKPTADLIICDPPYGTTKLKFDKTFDYDTLASTMKSILKPYGWLFFWGPAKLYKYPETYFEGRFEYVWNKPKANRATYNARRPGIKHELCFAFTHKNISRATMLYMDKHALRTPGKPYKRNNMKVSNTEFAKTIKAKPFIHVNTGYREGTSVLEYPSKGHMPLAERTPHPTQKPLALYEKLIQAFCPKGGIVYDPLAGSGTTQLACKNTSRKYVGCEKN